MNLGWEMRAHVDDMNKRAGLVIVDMSRRRGREGELGKNIEQGLDCRNTLHMCIGGVVSRTTRRHVKTGDV